MNSFENRLAAAGFSPIRPAAECWRVERLGAEHRLRGVAGVDPADSLALALWLDRLGEGPEPVAYRIRPLGNSD